MNLIKAHHAPTDQLDSFLKNNEHIDRDRLLSDGYIALRKGEIIGCFVLESVEKELYWLKQLYITKNAATTLPILLETILVLAKQNYAKEVYVHSHQPMVDVLLQTLQFHPQQENAFTNKLPRQKGTWWAYKVSS